MFKFSVAITIVLLTMMGVLTHGSASIAEGTTSTVSRRTFGTRHRHLKEGNKKGAFMTNRGTVPSITFFGPPAQYYDITENDTAHLYTLANLHQML